MVAEEIIRTELDGDPFGRGYAAMSDAEVLADLNTLYRDSWLEVFASDILEAIVPAALNDLDADARQDVDSVLSMGSEIDLSPGSRARTLLLTAFAGSPPTLNAIQNLGKTTISRATELDCGVSVSIVTAARGLEP